MAHRLTWLRFIWDVRAGLAVFVVGLAALWRSYTFFGRLLSGSDAQYYFGLTRSLVVDGDTDITNDMQLTPWGPPFDRDGDGYRETFRRTADGRVFNIFPIGLSLVEAPFLLIGRGVRWLVALFGYAIPGAPGYSDLEIWIVALGLLAIVAVAAGALHRLIEPLVGEPWALIAVLASWLGTSLFYYSAVFPFMAHALGFAVVVGIVTAANKVRLSHRTNMALLSIGGLSGLLFLVRPQLMTLAILLPPFLASVARRPVSSWMWGALGGVLVAVSALGLEIAYNLYELGIFRWTRYGTEAQKFNWLDAHLAAVLWETRRGLLWFSPVVLIAGLGFALTRFRGPWFAWLLALNGLAQIYLVAAWYDFEQSDSFGMRMFCESAAVVAVGLALAFRALSTRGRALVSVAVAASVVWTTYRLLLYVYGLER
jgi:hypothetical protein